MLQKFWDFDKSVIHEEYSRLFDSFIAIGLQWIWSSLANFLFARSGPASWLSAPSMARFPFGALK
jgi:hypothetical protein